MLFLPPSKSDSDLLDSAQKDSGSAKGRESIIQGNQAEQEVHSKPAAAERAERRGQQGEEVYSKSKPLPKSLKLPREAADEEVDIFDVRAQTYSYRWSLAQWNQYWLSRMDGVSGSIRGQQHEERAISANKSLFDLGENKCAEKILGKFACSKSQQETEEASVDEDRPAQPGRSIRWSDKKKLFAIPSLHLDELMAGKIDVFDTPEVIKEVDVASSCWKGEASSSKADRFMSMLPQGTLLNFSLSPAGAARWIYCISGAVTFAMCPPTPENLSKYAAWVQGAREAGVFLPDHCEGTAKAELTNGQILLIPAGWCTATSATTSSLLIGGYYFRLDSLSTHLDVLRIENHLRGRNRLGRTCSVTSRLRAREVMWFCAEKYASALETRAVLVNRDLKRSIDRRLGELKREEIAETAQEVMKQKRNRMARDERARTAIMRAAAKAAGVQSGKKRERRKKRRATELRDDFVVSDSDGSQEDEDGPDWVPDGPSDHELDEDLGDDTNLVDVSESRYRGGRRRTTRGLTFPANRWDGADTVRKPSTRHGGQVPEKLALLLKESNDDEEHDIVQSLRVESKTMPSSMPLKVKLKLGGKAVASRLAQPTSQTENKSKQSQDACNGSLVGSEGLDSEQCGSNHDVGLREIPQVDGVWDDYFDAWWDELGVAEDIDESNVQNVNALIRELRTWLMDEAKTLALADKYGTSRDASEAKALREKKQSVLARLEASAEALGLLKKSSSDLILGGYDVFSLEKVANKPSELSSMGLRYAWNGEGTEDVKRDKEQMRSDDEESVDGRQMSSPGGMADTVEKISQPQERSGSVDGSMNMEAVIGESVGCDVEAGAAKRKATGSERKTNFQSQTEFKKSRNVKKLSTRDRLKKKLRL